MSFVCQNTEAFMSQIGVEFIVNFSLHHQAKAGAGMNENMHSVSGKILS